MKPSLPFLLAMLMPMVSATALAKDDQLLELLRKGKENVESSAPFREPANVGFQAMAWKGMLDDGTHTLPPIDLRDPVAREAIPSYSVPVDELASCSEACRPSSLLKDYSEIVYLVRVADLAISTINMRRIESVWKTASYGTFRLATQIDAAMTRVASRSPHALRVLVNVRGLGVIFLGFLEGDVFMLTPVRTNGMSGIPRQRRLAGRRSVLHAQAIGSRSTAGRLRFRFGRRRSCQAMNLLR